MTFVRFLISVGILALPALVGAMELSGTVLGSDRKALGGVQVRLASANHVAISDDFGQWRIQTTATSLVQQDIRQSGATRATVAVENGRLRLLFAGRDLFGRVRGETVFRVGSLSIATRVQGATDTLVFSKAGKVLLLDTVSSSRTGIVRVLDSTFDPSLVYGHVTDSRDGQVYRTIRIGSQVWMAENLNFRIDVPGDTGWSVPTSSVNGAWFGRLYRWASLMNLADSCNSKSCASQIQPVHRGICPQDWHVPSDAEWETLVNAVGVQASAGGRLKATSGWKDYDLKSGNGTDEYGFHALPSGYVKGRNTFYFVGSIGGWMSSTEYNASVAWNRTMTNVDGWVARSNYDFYKGDGLSARCLLDHPDTTAILATPVFGLPDGAYSSSLSLTISTLPGFEIRYTDDGSFPTVTSPLYSSPIRVSETTTFRAIAVKSGKVRSVVSNATYTILGGVVSTGPGMKLIPAGTFTMGSPTTEIGRFSDEVQHRVTLSSFWMDSTVVTQRQYRTVMGLNPSANTDCGSSCPVEQVSWFDAVLYCNARSKRDGLDTVYSYTSMTGTYGRGVTALGGITANLGRNGYRLPTEAQWEYAARGGTTTRYYWGELAGIDTLGKYAWYSGNSGYSTQPVATKPANPYGLYDMAGSVRHWINDWFGNYLTTELTDPEGPSSGREKVYRGGSWNFGAQYFRSAYRDFSEPGNRNINHGFRTVRPAPRP